jgi:hypothetical protein
LIASDRLLYNTGKLQRKVHPNSMSVRSESIVGIASIMKSTVVQTLGELRMHGTAN